MRPLIDHCRALSSKSEYAPAKNGAKASTNEMAAKVIHNLWENGFLITGFDAYGNLEFSVITKSKIQIIFEGTELERLKRMPIDEIRKQTRKG